MLQAACYAAPPDFGATGIHDAQPDGNYGDANDEPESGLALSVIRSKADMDDRASALFFLGSFSRSHQGTEMLNVQC